MCLPANWHEAATPAILSKPAKPRVNYDPATTLHIAFDARSACRVRPVLARARVRRHRRPLGPLARAYPMTQFDAEQHVYSMLCPEGLPFVAERLADAFSI